MVFLLEDDMVISEGLEYSLNQEGFKTIIARSCKEATNVINSNINSIDFAILDVSLPDGTGYEICKLLKSKKDVPIIFLTACDDEVNVVRGLDMGADDYITKPFRIRELISRINSVTRRYDKINIMDMTSKIIIGKNVVVDINHAKAYRDGKDIELTALEYKLLLTFINNKGQVLSRNQLLEGIWDINGDFVNDNTLTVYIKRLRSKLGDNDNNAIIETVRGRGYRMVIGD